MKLFDFVYDIAIGAYALLCLPKALFDQKKSLLKRLGKDFPSIEKNGRQLIWVHAVSMGEVNAAIPLIKKLKAQNPSPLVLISTVTETGQFTAQQKIPEADFHTYLPLDLSWIIRPILKRVQPDLVLITETDLWYHFQKEAKKTAPIAVINAKISERSFRRYQKFPYLCKKLLQPIDHFFVQGELYHTRFSQLGLTQLTVSGNLKLDHTPQTPPLGVQKVLTLGSTHFPEEEIWLKALKNIWKTDPDLKVYLVPRHLKRFSEVEKLLQSLNISYAKWSEQGSFDKVSVVLVDTMGQLNTCYAQSKLAFVGGSFTKSVGGHNICEPAFYKKAVLFGPYMHSQPDFLSLVRYYKAGLQIQPSEIETTIQNLFSHPSQIEEMGKNGERMIQESQGALDTTFNLVLRLRQNKSVC